MKKIIKEKMTFLKHNVSILLFSIFFYTCQIMIEYKSVSAQCDNSDNGGDIGNSKFGIPGYGSPIFLGGDEISFIYIASNKGIQMRTTEGFRIQTFGDYDNKQMQITADGQEKLLVSDFTSTEVEIFNKRGEQTGVYAKGFNEPGAIAVDRSNNVYISNSNGKEVMKFDPVGKLLQTIQFPSKVIRMDVHPDQCMILYITEKRNVSSLNICPDEKKMPSFESVIIKNGQDLKFLSNGDILIANEINIVKLNSSGIIMKTYDIAGNDNWSSLALDPDGKTFWCADFGNSNVFRFDIATGDVISHFNSDTGPQTINGLAIIGPHGTDALPVSNAILNLKLSFEAMFAFPQQISVTLRNSNSPYEIIDVKEGAVNPDGSCNPLNFSNVISGSSYYIIVNHRNSIETWSSIGISFDVSPANYDFTINTYEAFGDNMTMIKDRASIYSGDINQDGTIDGTDMAMIDNAKFNTSKQETSFNNVDLNGDNMIDETDFAIADNNAINFVNVIRPLQLETIHEPSLIEDHSRIIIKNIPAEIKEAETGRGEGRRIEPIPVPD